MIAPTGNVGTLLLSLSLDSALIVQTIEPDDVALPVARARRPGEDDAASAGSVRDATARLLGIQERLRDLEDTGGVVLSVRCPSGDRRQEGHLRSVGERRFVGDVGRPEDAAHGRERAELGEVGQAGGACDPAYPWNALQQILLGAPDGTLFDRVAQLAIDVAQLFLEPFDVPFQAELNGSGTGH